MWGELTKGQIVYLKPGVNKVRDNTAIREGIVKIIGHKYITVSLGEISDYRFYKDTLEEFTRYAPSYYLYESKQQILDETEHYELSQFISKTFNHRGKRKLTLEQLRQIKAIIEGRKGK